MLNLWLMVQSFKVIKQLSICIVCVFHSQTSQFFSAHRTRKYWMHLSQYQFTAWRHKTLSIQEESDKSKTKKTFSLRLIILDFVKIEGEPCDWPACFDSKGATVLPGAHRQQTFLMGTAAVVAGPGQQDDNATDRHTENNALLSCSPQSIPVFAAYVALETLQVNWHFGGSPRKSILIRLYDTTGIWLISSWRIVTHVQD